MINVFTPEGLKRALDQGHKTIIWLDMCGDRLKAVRYLHLKELWPGLLKDLAPNLDDLEAGY